MIYLLAKYTLLFLLASILGFVLGYWWSRRNFVDVSESYEDLRKATDKTDAANWKQLWGRLDALPEPKETDLSSVFQRLEGVQGAVSAIPRPDPVDFAPLESRLDSLEQKIRAIPQPKETDLTTVFKRLEGVQGAVTAIPRPNPVDFTPLESRLDSLEQKIRAIPEQVDIGLLSERLQGVETAVHNIPAPPSKVDLQPVHKDLSTIREQITRLPKVETHQPVSLTPVVRKIDTLEKRVNAIPRPNKVDLKPIDKRLRVIESEIGKLGKRITRPSPATRTPSRKSRAPAKRSGQPKILSTALYGKKDDLKRILGVGPKLERLLNKNGVYYFWQVASWSRKDIDTIDERLDNFKGRISRDDWVSQAKRLKRSPEAARTPST